MEDMEELGEAEEDLSSSFLSPSLPEVRKGWHLRLSVCASFFREAEAEWDFLVAPLVCSLSRLWVEREIWWSCGHNVSLVDICMGDINGINRNNGIYIMLKGHKRLHSYFLSSN